MIDMIYNDRGYHFKNGILDKPPPAPNIFKSTYNLLFTFLLYLEWFIFDCSKTKYPYYMGGGAFVNATVNSDDADLGDSGMYSYHFDKNGIVISSSPLQHDYFDIQSYGKQFFKSLTIVTVKDLILKQRQYLSIIAYEPSAFQHYLVIYDVKSKETRIRPFSCPGTITCFAIKPFNPDSHSSKMGNSQDNTLFVLSAGLKAEGILNSVWALKTNSRGGKVFLQEQSKYIHVLAISQVPTAIDVEEIISSSCFRVVFGAENREFGILEYEYWEDASIQKTRDLCFPLEYDRVSIPNPLLSRAPITGIEILPACGNTQRNFYVMVSQGMRPRTFENQSYHPHFTLLKVDSERSLVLSEFEIPLAIDFQGALVKAKINLIKGKTYLALMTWIGKTNNTVNLHVLSLDNRLCSSNLISSISCNLTSDEFPLDFNINILSKNFNILFNSGVSKTMSLESSSSDTLLTEDFFKLSNQYFNTNNKPVTKRQDIKPTLLISLIGQRLPIHNVNYPFSKGDEAIQLNSILDFTCNTIKNEVFYYILLDYFSSSELNQYVKDHLPSQASNNLIKGFWYIDKKRFLLGVECLCSSNISLKYANEVLNILVEAHESKAIGILWDYYLKSNIVVVPDNPHAFIKSLFSSHAKEILPFIGGLTCSEVKRYLYYDFFEMTFGLYYKFQESDLLFVDHFTAEVEECLVRFIKFSFHESYTNYRLTYKSAFNFYIHFLTNHGRIGDAVAYYLSNIKVLTLLDEIELPPQFRFALDKKISCDENSNPSCCNASESKKSQKKPKMISRVLLDSKVRSLLIKRCRKTTKSAAPMKFFSRVCNNVLDCNTKREQDPLILLCRNTKFFKNLEGERVLLVNTPDNVCSVNPNYIQAEMALQEHNMVGDDFQRYSYISTLNQTTRPSNLSEQNSNDLNVNSFNFNHSASSASEVNNNYFLSEGNSQTNHSNLYDPPEFFTTHPASNNQIFETTESRSNINVILPESDHITPTSSEQSSSNLETNNSESLPDLDLLLNYVAGNSEDRHFDSTMEEPVELRQFTSDVFNNNHNQTGSLGSNDATDVENFNIHLQELSNLTHIHIDETPVIEDSSYETTHSSLLEESLITNDVNTQEDVFSTPETSAMNSNNEIQHHLEFTNETSIGQASLLNELSEEIILTETNEESFPNQEIVEPREHNSSLSDDQQIVIETPNTSSDCPSNQYNHSAPLEETQYLFDENELVGDMHSLFLDEDLCDPSGINEFSLPENIPSTSSSSNLNIPRREKTVPSEDEIYSFIGSITNEPIDLQDEILAENRFSADHSPIPSPTGEIFNVNLDDYFSFFDSLETEDILLEIPVLNGARVAKESNSNISLETAINHPSDPNLTEVTSSHESESPCPEESAVPSIILSENVISDSDSYSYNSNQFIRTDFSAFARNHRFCTSYLRSHERHLGIKYSNPDLFLDVDPESPPLKKQKKIHHSTNTF